MVQNSSDIITLLGADGTVFYVSPAIKRVLGYSPEERIGENTIDLVHPDDAPSFELPASPNQTVDEDAGARTVAGFATSISAGPADESSQAVSFDVTDDNPALFSDRPEISPGGALTYTPAPNASGTATVSARLEDDGGTANGGDDESPVRTFNIAVSAVNDAPTVMLSGPGAANEGDTVTYTYTAVDLEPGGLTLESGFPDCGSGGELVGAPSFAEGPEAATVRVQISDLQGEVSIIATKSLTVSDVASTIIMKGPGSAKQGQTKTFQFFITDPGEDTFDFVAGYPSCGKGGVLVSETIGADSGSFQCKFVKPAKATLVLKVQDLDGSLSSTASWRVKVAKAKKK